ncbi:hypothetical protein OG729_24310 [Streptomyces sp. NBC_00210]|uniref:hypothetical protein n=1 Tax=unclassified Streptomyces TaxID=2593676 RepID=UPI003252AAD9
MSTEKNRNGRLTPAVALGTVVVLAVAVGAFFLAGGDDWVRNDDSVATACGNGIVPKQEVASLLGTDSLTAKKGTPSFDTDAGWTESCAVGTGSDGDGKVDIGIGWSDKTRGILSVLGRSNATQGPALATPIGPGWPGFVTVSGSSAHGVVQMSCAGGGNRGLVVAVNAYAPETVKSFSRAEDRDQFTRVARIVTEVAGKAAGPSGCDTRLGGEIKPLTSVLSAPGDAGERTGARGTCQAVAPVMSSGRVLETPAEMSPIEDCQIVNDQGRPLFQFTALYGVLSRNVFETPEGEAFQSKESGIAPPSAKSGADVWASATCGSSGEPARYVATSAEKGRAPDDPSLEAARRMLVAFAEDSARRHGCTDLVEPK